MARTIIPRRRAQRVRFVDASLMRHRGGEAALDAGFAARPAP
jgi:hypothetical protein